MWHYTLKFLSGIQLVHLEVFGGWKFAKKVINLAQEYSNLHCRRQQMAERNIVPKTANWCRSRNYMKMSYSSVRYMAILACCFRNDLLQYKLRCKCEASTASVCRHKNDSRYKVCREVAVTHGHVNIPDDFQIR